MMQNNNHKTSHQPPTIHFGIITLFPDIFDSLNHGITGKAIANRKVMLSYYNLIDFTKTYGKRADDKPYGGGPGMILRYEPIRDAIVQAKKDLGQSTKIIYMSPQGNLLEHSTSKEYARLEENLIIICGRYEGIDQRIIDEFVTCEISLGDYIVSCGDIAAIVFIDSIIRQIEGILGNDESSQSDSLSNGLLEYPQYTRPAKVDGMEVPKVLLDGNHQEIEKWRNEQSIISTWKKRPDLLPKAKLSTVQNHFLSSLQKKNLGDQ